MARVVHRLKPWLRFVFPGLALLSLLAALAASGPLAPSAPQTASLVPTLTPSEDAVLPSPPLDPVEDGPVAFAPVTTATPPEGPRLAEARGEMTPPLRGGPLAEGAGLTVARSEWTRASRLARRTVLDVPGLGEGDGAVDAATALTTTVESAAAALQAARLDKVGEVWQTLNNCGPASVSMVLAYYGQTVSQATAQSSLRAPKEWGMLPGAIPPYVTGFDLEARILDHGTLEDLKALLQRGVPVIVAQWLTEQQPIPHYRVVIGYDDIQEEFFVNDGVLGFGKAIKYEDFASLWDVYHNLYLPIFRQQDAAEIQGLLGTQWDHTVTFVSIYKSRPAWDALLRAGGSGEPTAEPTEEATPEPEPTPTPEPNSGPDAAWPLAQQQTATGTLAGASAGAFAFYRVKAEAGGHLDFHYLPDDGVIAKGVGVRVYAGSGKLVGEAVNVSGRVGERTVALPSEAGVYLVQVYNYLPGVTIEFSLTWR